MKKERRTHHGWLLCGAAAVALATAGAAHAADARFDIAPQPLSTALAQFGVQAQQGVFADAALTSSKMTKGVTGAKDTEVALNELLAGTGLSWRREGQSFVIVQGGSGDPQGGSAAGGGATVEALIVTAQKREEDIQDVPIAISAFSQESLDAQKLEGGFDLLKAIPNVTFSKNNFTGYNFSIRGIGTKAISATTDPGVAVSFNNTALIVNRLFEQEYFDVERVEVLRGPQGTLYGRNATSGVINVIPAKPRLGEFEGEVKLETGNYGALRTRAMVNLPLGETLAVRVAGASTKRDGYGFNTFDSSDVDNRDLWSSRVTVGWEPTPTFRADLLWEHFEEDDQRVRTSKQLCHRDPGPEFLGDFRVSDHPHPVFRHGADLSQGCLPGSLYDKGTPEAQVNPLTPGFDHGAYGTPYGTSIPSVFGSYIAVALTGFFGVRPDALDPSLAPCPELAAGELDYAMGFILDLCQIDPYGGLGQVRDLRTIESRIPPAYRAKADVFDLTWDWEVAENLSLTSQTVYNQDEIYSTQDFNRFTTLPVFQDTSVTCDIMVLFTGAPCVGGGHIWSDYAPGGVYTDPQLGPSDTIVGQDISQGESTQFSQEFRLASSWDSPLNFSVGANYTKFETEIDYYVFFNLLSYIAEKTGAFNGPLTSFFGMGGQCFNTGLTCVYVDPNPLDSIDGEGHNYFRSKNPYKLESSAIFGELYWQVTPTVKLTAGLRYSQDEKVFTPHPSQLLLPDYRESNIVPEGAPPEACNIDTLNCQAFGNAPGGKGYPADPDIVQKWTEPTGRFVVDWKPDLTLTDDTMVYVSLAHGYKGGGANPPGIAPPAILYIEPASHAVAGKTFEPEYVDAFEVGTKNTLLGGGLILNATAFHYSYEGYQVSKIVNRSAANENFDATIWGLEFEGVFNPSRSLRFNWAMGFLDGEIADGEFSIDLMDRTQGGNRSFTAADGRVFDQWVVLKPWITGSSNCVAPLEIVEMLYEAGEVIAGRLCPGGGILGNSFVEGPAGGPGSLPDGTYFNPLTDAPNAGAGFFDDLGGNELPNAPHWTASVGAQYRFLLPAGWEATLRGDFYWQSQSYARVYNTQYDKLRAWTNTNISLWFEKPDWDLKAEVYVKNVFDEEPITDAFLNGDDAALTTNVFTLDPRLVGVSITKGF